jgi:hypothetical protein
MIPGPTSESLGADQIHDWLLGKAARDVRGERWIRGLHMEHGRSYCPCNGILFFEIKIAGRSSEGFILGRSLHRRRLLFERYEESRPRPISLLRSWITWR